MPRFSKFSASQEDSRSVIAAFKKRFCAVLPENGKCSGWPRGSGEASFDSYLCDIAISASELLRTATGLKSKSRVCAVCEKIKIIAPSSLSYIHKREGMLTNAS